MKSLLNIFAFKLFALNKGWLGGDIYWCEPFTEDRLLQNYFPNIIVRKCPNIALCYLIGVKGHLSPSGWLNKAGLYLHYYLLYSTNHSFRLTRFL